MDFRYKSQNDLFNPNKPSKENMGVGPLTTGLSTGINYGEIIEGLIKIEQRPIDSIQQKIDINNLKQQAYDELNGMALSAKLTMFDLASTSTFNSKITDSSNETVLTASADTSAAVSTHTVQVLKMAQSSLALSTGMSNSDTSTVGAGKLSFELGGKKLDEGTLLDDLNGGRGITRGEILITDSAGKSFEIDLSDAITTTDVINKFNSNTLDFEISVARTYSSGTFTGDGAYFQIKNNSGSNSITLSEVAGNTTLSDIGLKEETIASGGTSTNTNSIYYVTEDTKLNKVNDNMGIRTNASGTNDIRFYILDTVNNQYKFVEADLTGSEDLGDVINKINTAIHNKYLDAYASLKLASDGMHLQFDGTVADVQNINGSDAATDLGLTKLTSNKGEALVADMGSTLIRNLHGGSGIENLDNGVIRMNSASGNEYYANFNGSKSLADITRVITAAVDITLGTSSEFTAEINDTGNGLKITDSSTGTNPLVIEDVSGNVAKELGISTNIIAKPVIFNGYDFVNDTSATARKSSVFLDKNSLPTGITENDLIGRKIKHVYSSSLKQNAVGDATERNGIETATILAFDAAPDDFYIDSSTAATSSATLSSTGADKNSDGTNEDQLVDATNLKTATNSSLNTTNIIGASLVVHTTSGTATSSIVNYDSSTGTIILADNAVSTMLTTASTTIGNTGYTISYNHKLILDYPDAYTVDPTAATLDTTGPTYGLTDANITSTNVDISRIIGATVTLTQTSTGTTYSDVVTGYTTAGTLDFTTNNIATAANSAIINSDATYTINYAPIHNGNNGNNTYLDQNTNNPDQIVIQGINTNTYNGDNLEQRMMSGETRLDSLNGGNGIDRGKFTIGVGSSTAEIDLTQTKIQTVQDLIDEVNSKITSVKFEVNDRGDGLRIYDITADQSTYTGVTVNDLANGASASNLNIETAFSKKQVSVSRTTTSGGTTTSEGDFYSYQGTASATTLFTNPVLTVPEFAGLDPKEVVGSTISFISKEAGQERRIFALVGAYTVNGSGNAELSIYSPVYEVEDGTTIDTATLGTTHLDGQTVNLHLKKHFDEYEDLGTVKTRTVISNNLGTMSLELNDTKSMFANMAEEEIVGALINISSTQSSVNEGETAMVTDYSYNAGTGTATIIVQGHLIKPNNVPASGSTISFARKNGARHQINGGLMTKSLNFRKDLAANGFSSVTATVKTGTTATQIFSDQFASLDPLEIVGSLVTIKSSTQSGKVGNMALVTDYDSASKSITIDGFKTTSGTTDATTLSANDEVYITYESDLEGAVIRSASQSTVTFSTAVTGNVTTLDSTQSNRRLLDVTGLYNGSLTYSTSANISGGSFEKYIGATLTFTSGNNNGESRTIVDIIRDFGSTANNTVLVLDRELPQSTTTTDSFTVTFPDIVATIEEVDFSSGVITTREKMETGMGDRSYNIHPVIDGTFQKEVQLLSTDTLLDAVVKINNANVGVKASVINDGSGSNPFRLSMTANTSGADGSVIVDSNITGFDVTQATVGQDAKIIVGDSSGNSSVVVGNTNTITSAITGLTLNIKGTSSEQIVLSVSPDKSSLSEKAETFATELNTLLDAANQLTALENNVTTTDENGNQKSTKQKGLLFGDFTTRNLITQIKGLLNKQVTGVQSGHYSLLTDIGFDLNADGTAIEFNASEFSTALDSNFDQVKNLFTTIPNISSQISFGLNSSTFLQSGFSLNDLRNGLTRSSGFLEKGGGTNGVKLQAGDTTKKMSISLGNATTLYGIKLHHHVPTDLTAEYAKSNNEIKVSGATISSAGQIDKITDTTYFHADANLISSELIGATVTIGSATSTITAYDVNSSTITLANNNISTGLGNTGTLSGLTTGGYSIKTTSGNLSFSYNAVLEYKDPTTGNYVTYQNLSNITDGALSVIFPNGLTTDELRLSYDDHTGHSEDFTKNGYFARLLEVEVMESQGLGQQINQSLNTVTDGQTGSIPQANSTIATLNETYNAQITRLNEKIENKRNLLVRQFQNLELIVSNLNSQSSFLLSSLNSLPQAFSHRK